MKMFFIVFISLISYLNFLIGAYYADAFSLSGIARAVFWSIHALATLTVFAAPYVYRVYPVKKPGFFYNALQWCGYIFFGIYSVLLMLMFINLTGQALIDQWGNVSSKSRLFFKSVLACTSLGVTAIVSTVGFFEARRRPKIKRVKVPIAHLPSEFEGVTILQMSDLHVGQTIKSDYVEKLVEMSNVIKPDMVVLTGDMIDGIRPQLEEELLSFKKISAPLGKFMVPGNHEYYWGVTSWINFWKEIGFSPLINQHLLVEKNEG
ncbi:MAG: metallophosphoesterase, partial [Bacteriovorax sp.]